MFHKIIDVHNAVFKYFSERISEELGVHVRYARKSSHDYSEEQDAQIYPCVAIQEYFPVPKEDWWIEYKGFHRATSVDGSTGYLYYLPLWMDFRYDMSVASKSYKDYVRIQQWFLENTIAEDEITLESFVVNGMETGEPISIETRVQDIPRTDGVYETNYEITFSIWLYARRPVGIDTVQDVVLRLHRAKESDLDFDSSFNEDFPVFVAHNFTMTECPFKSLTDYLAQIFITTENYSGIRGIAREEYDSLEVKDPDMIYVIR